ncbi:ATP-dependent DNA helicase PIF1 [Tolypocladium capitatum]|uniref:ATP-dependent DNA helicase PIF1 n=1 Tax=Tolypocladium capitatum TaxID=45235 RepID=A0A2K3Q965_9HYPO|nr:ATP-dependent DNA helicase PIF1 [Tolypocladium capitatum]
MTAGITGLPIRSSPASRSILQRATRFAHVQVHSRSTHSVADTMLKRATSNQGSGNTQRGALDRQLFPSSSPSTSNGDIRDQFRRPGSTGQSAASASARTAQSSRNALGSRSANPTQPNREIAKESMMHLLHGGSDSFKQETAQVDLTAPDAQEKTQEAVYFAEDDFSDDDDLDLDYEAPTALPPSSKPPAREIGALLPTPSRLETGIPWSSSPASHFLPPNPQPSLSGGSTATQPSLKRESSGENDPSGGPIQKKAKKRVLPATFHSHKREEEEPCPAVMMTMTPATKSHGLWDTSASAIKEQKRQLRNQRNQSKADVDDPPEEAPDTEASLAPKILPVTLSGEQRHVLDLVVNKGASVFFTGPAGAGKSVLMRAIISELKQKYERDPERVAVTASTGLAACNIGGITLHSFSGIGLGKEDAHTLVKKVRRNPKAKNRWLKTKCLVIDEISMVDGELFDKLSHVGRVVRNNGRPWGGIQLIITGDFFQLPPVPDHDKKRESQFAFDAATWSTSIDHTIGLTQVFRQRDPEFARMLNEMRLGKISPSTVDAFRALSRPLKFDDGVESAELYPTRAQVESSNEKRLRELPGRAHRYDCMDSGDPAIKDKLLMNMMAPKSLELKINAQVMLIKNLDETLVNGSLGKVIAFSDEKTFEMTGVNSYDDGWDDPMAKAKRKLKGFSRDSNSSSSSNRQYPVVQFVAMGGVQRVILCQPEEWKVELPNGEVQAKRNQLPLILAWALSIHKAQGQTLERVTVNLGRVFEKGQAYVALSRATTQQGLRVLGFDKSKVMAHERVVEFYGKLNTAEQANGLPKPGAILDFVANRRGEMAQPKAPIRPTVKKTVAVVDLDDEEEAMASKAFRSYVLVGDDRGQREGQTYAVDGELEILQPPPLLRGERRTFSSQPGALHHHEPAAFDARLLSRDACDGVSGDGSPSATSELTPSSRSNAAPSRATRPVRHDSPRVIRGVQTVGISWPPASLDSKQLGADSRRTRSSNGDNMASQFIGLHMKVILRDPSGYCLTGTVRDVEAGSSLTLTNVYITATQERIAQTKIDAADIADLSEIPHDEPPSATYAALAPEPVAAPAFLQPPSQPTFVDPAILSVGRRPTSGTPSASGLQHQSDRGERHASEASSVPTVRLDSRRGDGRPEQDTIDSVKGLKVGTPWQEQNNGKTIDAREAQPQKKKTRSRKPKAHTSEQGAQATDGSQAATVQSAHGTGWRETPILESTASFQPFNSLKRQANGRKGPLRDNGWASEEVTEEMGDFDFENNLAKFDKRTIFDQMRKEDQVDDASRLVSHNRRAKPGTAGGKNLHHTENVLEVPSTGAAQRADFWNSEADTGVKEEARFSGRENRNGQGARRADSKSGAARRSQSRKASGVLGGQPLSRVNSAVRCSQASGRGSPSRWDHAVTDYRQQQGHQPGLYLVPSNRRLEAISTLQMVNLENIAASELGFSEGLMAENAGRGIAEVAVTALSDPAMKVRFELAVASSSADASLGSSAIVILAGNNKSGVRALAAGRHLRNKNMDVIVCVVGIERERDLLEDLRRQMQLYRNFGGKVLSKNDLFEHLRKSSASGSPVPISLIVDALLGLTISFEELRIGDQATVYELMEWANRNEAFVLSVDVPTGIDPTSGKVAIIDGSHLYVKPRYVVAIGAPKRGLLEIVTPPSDGEPGLSSNAAQEDEWRLFIADMGLGSAVWRRAGTKVRRGIDFDGRERAGKAWRRHRIERLVIMLDGGAYLGRLGTVAFYLARGCESMYVGVEGWYQCRTCYSTGRDVSVAATDATHKPRGTRYEGPGKRTSNVARRRAKPARHAAQAFAKRRPALMSDGTGRTEPRCPERRITGGADVGSR